MIVDSDPDQSEQERDYHVSLNNFIDDDSQIGNDISDFYRLTNINRPALDAVEEPNQLFSSLKAAKKNITLDLNYQTFEKQCFVVNQMLMK